MYGYFNGTDLSSFSYLWSPTFNSETMSLKHDSSGLGAERHIRVSRPRSREKKSHSAATSSPSTDTTSSKNCKFEALLPVPHAGGFDVMIDVEELLIELPAAAAVSAVTTKKTKSKITKPVILAASVEDDDLDTLLHEFAFDATRCHHHGCLKKNVKMVGVDSFL